MTIVEFLTARLDEDETEAQRAASFARQYAPAWTSWFASHHTLTGAPVVAAWPARALADIAAKRAIIELHKQWPILIDGPPKFETDASRPDSVAFKMSQQIAWTTEQEYRDRFGDEPPTAPMMRALASVYSDHLDYRQEWKL